MTRHLLTFSSTRSSDDLAVEPRFNGCNEEAGELKLTLSNNYCTGCLKKYTILNGYY